MAKSEAVAKLLSKAEEFAAKGSEVLEAAKSSEKLAKAGEVAKAGATATGKAVGRAASKAGETLGKIGENGKTARSVLKGGAIVGTGAIAAKTGYDLVNDPGSVTAKMNQAVSGLVSGQSPASQTTSASTADGTSATSGVQQASLTTQGMGMGTGTTAAAAGGTDLLSGLGNALGSVAKSIFNGISNSGNLAAPLAIGAGILAFTCGSKLIKGIGMVAAAAFGITALENGSVSNIASTLTGGAQQTATQATSTGITTGTTQQAQVPMLADTSGIESGTDADSTTYEA